MFEFIKDNLFNFKRLLFCLITICMRRPPHFCWEEVYLRHLGIGPSGDEFSIVTIMLTIYRSRLLEFPRPTVTKSGDFAQIKFIRHCKDFETSTLRMWSEHLTTVYVFQSTLPLFMFQLQQYYQCKSNLNQVWHSGHPKNSTNELAFCDECISDN